MILKTLSTRHMDGSELAEEISALSSGGYEPSPGVIYPTLQWLEDQDSNVETHGDRKTVYMVTSTVKDFLRKDTPELETVTEFFDEATGGDAFPLRRSAARLERTILISLPETSEKRRAEVAKVLDPTVKITKMMNQP